ncbi:NAD-dependent protein deacetylase [Geoglobus acetivorans]|uniref:NAD-dependent protein deacylase n=1 Tax=Geoglobus acetivorans TaxID=565033 RepID=A0ABZ3H6Q5_GEOAI|nr:NAD-dependent protein deacylase [Geoglobus acetivorans]
MEDRIRKAAEAIANASHAVVFTGAGVSAESGVPTFRGHDGLWTKYDPEEVASIQGFKRNPKAFWEFSKELMVKRKAEPNPAHFAIAELEEMGIVRAVITQNVDVLHQRAGSKRVLELHGSMEKVDCLDCGATYHWDDIEEMLIRDEEVKCECGSHYLKPRVVLFGEPLPSDTLNQAIAESRQADVFMVVGSSLVVYPAAYLPLYAREAGATLIMINADETQADVVFDIVIHGKAGEILPEIVEEVKRHRRINR